MHYVNIKMSLIHIRKGECNVITVDQLKEIYAQLSADLPTESIQSVKKEVSKKGYDATGHGYQYIINRLNEVVFGHWRMFHEVVSKNVREKNTIDWYDVTIKVIIQIGNRHFINGQSVFEVLAEGEGYGGHSARNEYDAYKGAHTNAIKKAAAMLGIGKRAYEGTLDEDYFDVEAHETGSYQEAQRQYQQQRINKSKIGNKKYLDAFTEVLKETSQQNEERFKAANEKWRQDPSTPKQQGMLAGKFKNRIGNEKKAEIIRKAWLKHSFGIDSSKLLTKGEIYDLIDKIENMRDEEFNQCVTFLENRYLLTQGAS